MVLTMIVIGHHRWVVAARDITTLDESDWQWFGKLCLDREWGEKERIAAIKTEKSTIVDKFSYEAIAFFAWYILSKEGCCDVIIAN